jgi:hypothetical protein
MVGCPGLVYRLPGPAAVDLMVGTGFKCQQNDIESKEESQDPFHNGGLKVFGDQGLVYDVGGIVDQGGLVADDPILVAYEEHPPVKAGCSF